MDDFVMMRVYRRFVAAIVARAALDYIRPDRLSLRESAVGFFESELFTLLAGVLDIEPREFIVSLNARRREYYSQECNPDGVGLRDWLRERAE